MATRDTSVAATREMISAADDLHAACASLRRHVVGVSNRQSRRTMFCDLQPEYLRSVRRSLARLDVHLSHASPKELMRLRDALRVASQCIRLTRLEIHNLEYGLISAQEFLSLFRDNAHRQLKAIRSAQSGPIRRRQSLSVTFIEVAAILLPAAYRGRYIEEWRGELASLDSRLRRALFARETIVGIPRLALTLRPLSQLPSLTARAVDRILGSDSSTAVAIGSLLAPIVAFYLLHGGFSEFMANLGNVAVVAGALHVLARWLRKRRGVAVRRRDRGPRKRP
jgi:hypothetical protein